jgi:hypothetical protein
VRLPIKVPDTLPARATLGAEGVVRFLSDDDIAMPLRDKQRLGPFVHTIEARDALRGCPLQAVQPMVLLGEKSIRD